MPRVPASGLHSSNRPAASGLSVPKDAEDAFASASVATVVFRATRAPRVPRGFRGGDGDVGVDEADPRLRGGRRAEHHRRQSLHDGVPRRRKRRHRASYRVPGGDANRAAADARTAAEPPRPAPRPATPPARRTEHIEATPPPPPRTPPPVGRDGLQRARHRAELPPEIPREVGRARAAAARRRWSDDDASRASAPRSPATRSTNPDRGSNPSSRIRVSTPARPGLTPIEAP